MADITVVGNITEPTLKFTNSAKPVLSFSVADDHRRKNGDQWEDDGSTWYRVTAWDRAAETLADALQKGDRVIVVGQVRSSAYTGRDGSERSSLELTARHVGIIPRAPRQEQSQGVPGSPARSQGWGEQSQQQDPWAGSAASDDVPF